MLLGLIKLIFLVAVYGCVYYISVNSRRVDRFVTKTAQIFTHECRIIDCEGLSVEEVINAY